MAETRSGPVLEVRGAVRRYGAIMALDHANLMLHQGEILALLGDNGAGKSTLIKSINGVGRLDEGEVLLEGQKIDGRPPQSVRGLGIETVHQNLALFDNLSATENLFAGREATAPRWMGPFGFRCRKAMRHRTAELLRELRVGIADPDLLIGLMSGGQRQATAVARAHAFASKVVLLDEPTAALGIREAQAVLEIIKALPGRGISAILVSHNLDHVAQVADRAVVMRQGCVVGEAAPSPENHEKLVGMIVGSRSELSTPSQLVSQGE